MASTTIQKNQTRNTTNVKGTGTVDETSLVSATTSGDALQSPVVVASNLPNPPVMIPGMDLSVYLSELRKFTESLVVQEEQIKENKRRTLRAKAEAIQAELDPLIVERDSAKREYDRLSSLCESKKASINEILSDSVFPQVKKAGSGKRVEHTPEDSTPDGVLYVFDKLGNKVCDDKGRWRVDRRSLRHQMDKNPSIASKYDYQLGVALFSL